MSRAWPAKEYASYMDRPLKEIRAEFGIRVVSQGGDAGSHPRPAGAALEEPCGKRLPRLRCTAQRRSLNRR